MIDFHSAALIAQLSHAPRPAPSHRIGRRRAALLVLLGPAIVVAAGFADRAVKPSRPILTGPALRRSVRRE